MSAFAFTQPDRFIQLIYRNTHQKTAFWGESGLCEDGKNLEKGMFTGLKLSSGRFYSIRGYTHALRLHINHGCKQEVGTNWCTSIKVTLSIDPLFTRIADLNGASGLENVIRNGITGSCSDPTKFNHSASKAQASYLYSGRDKARL